MAFAHLSYSNLPNVEVNERDDIITPEVMREGVWNLEAYVEEISSSNAVDAPINVDKVYASVLKLWNVVQSRPGMSKAQVSRIKDLYDPVINSLNARGPETELEGAPQPRTLRASYVPGFPVVSIYLRTKFLSSISSIRSERTGNTPTTSQESTSTSPKRSRLLIPRLFKDKHALSIGVGKGLNKR